MRVFVTGGTGGVGSFVTEQLVAAGHHPVLYGRGLRNDLITELAYDSYTFVQGSVGDRAELTKAVLESGAQRIVHMSAMLDACQLDPAQAVAVNVDATVNVLEAARLAGVDRVVFTSSKRAFGPVVGDHGYPTYQPITEDYPARPVMMYDITKFAGEVIGDNYERIFGLQFVSIRFAQTYGPGKLGLNLAAQPAIRSEMIENAVKGIPVRIPKGGDGRDDCIYAKDVAQGVVKAALVDTLGHRLFHLGSGLGVSLHDFGAALRTVIPDVDLEIGPGVDLRDDVPYRFECVFDISRARAELGFEPKYDLAAGIADYIDVMHRLNMGRATQR